MIGQILGSLLLANLGRAQYVDPNTAMAGVYTECVFKFDWACLQRRTLMFVDRLGRAPEFPLLPGVKLVRTEEEEPQPLDESILPVSNSEQLGEMVDNAVVDFFDQHVIRLHVPDWMRDTGRSYKEHIDLFFGDRHGKENEAGGPRGDEENDLEVASGRMMCGGGGGGKCKGGKGAKKAKKGMKKCLMMLCMMMAGKMVLLGPLMMGLMKLASLKALGMSLASLLMSKSMMMKGKGKGKGMMAMMNPWQGGGTGGGWDSSGGGGDSGWQSGGGGGGGWQPSGGGGGSGPYRRSVRPPQEIYTYSTLKDSVNPI